MSEMSDFMAMPPYNRVLLSAAALRSESDKRRWRKVAPEKKVEDWNVKQTRHAVIVDWSEMKGSSRHSKRVGFEQIIALCKDKRKDELVVENIAPGYKIGKGDPEIVIAAQERIFSIVSQASETQLGEPPEYRLSLRGQTFDLRFYLRRKHQANYVGAFDDY